MELMTQLRADQTRIEKPWQIMPPSGPLTAL